MNCNCKYRTTVDTHARLKLFFQFVVKDCSRTKYLRRVVIDSVIWTRRAPLNSLSVVLDLLETHTQMMNLACSLSLDVYLIRECTRHNCHIEIITFCLESVSHTEFLIWTAAICWFDSWLKREETHILIVWQKWQIECSARWLSTIARSEWHGKLDDWNGKIITKSFISIKDKEAESRNR